MKLSDLEVPPGPATALGAVPSLRLLPAGVRQLVEDGFTTVAYPFAVVIVREGDPADAVYVLTAGTARARLEGASSGPCSAAPGLGGGGRP